MLSPTFIIDGNNVVFYNSKKPHLQYLIALLKELKKHGNTIPIVSHELQFRIDDRNGLQALIQKGIILQTPQNVDCDLFILETCKKVDGFIISNDSFKEYKPYFLHEISHRFPFMIIRSSNGLLLLILPWKHQLQTSEAISDD